MFWLKTIVVGRSSSRRPGTKEAVNFSFSTCYLLTLSLAVFSLLYFSLSPSQLTLFVCWTSTTLPPPFTMSPPFVLTFVLSTDARLSSSTSSVITVMVTKTLYIYSTAVLAQGVFSLRVTVARNRRDFQLLCPCGELNLLQAMTNFMYHQLYHSEILCSPHNAFMCFAWIWEQTMIISLYHINLSVFITEAESVYCAVRAGSLTQIQFRP
jgi:hypothetical protein